MKHFSVLVRRSTACTRGLLLLIVALAFGSVGPAAAQTVSVRGNVGAAFFRSPEPTKQLLHSGSNLGLEASLRVTRGLSITLEGTYDSFTLNEENALLYNQGGSDKSFLGGALGLRYTLVNNSDAHPYIGLGGGIYKVRNTDPKQVNGNELVATENSLENIEEGVHIALGSTFRIDETFAVFAEPRYVFFDINRGVGDAVRYFTVRLGMDVTL